MLRPLALCTLLLRAASQHACTPGGPQALFVVASGRSGSTSLLRLLRSIPGSDFLGENDGIVPKMSELDTYLAYGRREVLSYSLVSNHAPWVFNAAAGRAQFVEAYRALVYATLNWRTGPSVRLVGFKEVRWLFHTNLTDVDFLFELFPCAKVLLNYRRDVETQARSNMWGVRSKMTSENSRDVITQHNAVLLAYHVRRPEQTLLIATEELGSTQALQAMLDWLSPSLGCTVLTAARTNANGSIERLSSLEQCSEAAGCTPRADLTRLLSCV